MLVAWYGRVDFYFLRAHNSPDACKNQIVNSSEFLIFLSHSLLEQTKKIHILMEVGILKHIGCLMMISETAKSQETG